MAAGVWIGANLAGWVRLATAGGLAVFTLAAAGSLMHAALKQSPAGELQELRQLVQKDFLTGVYNRGAVEAQISQRLEKAPERFGVLILLDIDDFKATNDHFGHLCGDDALKTTADKLRAFFPADSWIGRVGGDEFVVFTDVCPDRAAVFGMLERLHRCFLAPAGQTPAVTVSLGAACFPQDGRCFSALFHRSDLAMYHAKQTGKNTWRVFSGAMDAAGEPVSQQPLSPPM